MSKFERRIYSIGVVCAALLILEMLCVFLDECGYVAYAAEEHAVEHFIDQTDESPENSQIREMSGMPCENPEQFERWLATYEQTASEETGRESHENAEAIEAVIENSAETASTEEDDTKVETDISCKDVHEVVSSSCQIYTINGEVLNPELQSTMYDALNRHGIPYFYEIGICQMWQESRGNIFAENPNGKDKGVLQYRLQYWDWNRGDIFDPAAQIELYAEQMAARLNAGLSADECISRHKTSDYSAAVDWTYVQQVKQHLPMMEEIR